MVHFAIYKSTCPAITARPRRGGRSQTGVMLPDLGWLCVTSPVLPSAWSRYMPFASNGRSTMPQTGSFPCPRAGRPSSPIPSAGPVKSVNIFDYAKAGQPSRLESPSTQAPVDRQGFFLFFRIKEAQAKDPPSTAADHAEPAGIGRTARLLEAFIRDLRSTAHSSAKKSGGFGYYGRGRH